MSAGRRFTPLASLVLVVSCSGPALAQAPSRLEKDPVVASLTLFAGSTDGLWWSRDWGGAWERVVGEKPGVPLDAQGRVHAVVALGTEVFVASDDGLHASDDFGRTWRRLDLAGPVFSLQLSRYPQADPTILAGGRDGLWKSTDWGRTFARTPLAAGPVWRIEWPGPALVLATARGVFTSPDGGTSFVAAAGLPPGDARALALSSYFVADPVAFVAVDGRGVFRSADGGRTFAPAGLEGRLVMDLAWLGPRLYAATDDGVRHSEDSGRTWERLGEGLAGRTYRLLFPLAPDSAAEILAATDRGVFRTADGGLSWRASGMIGQEPRCLGTFPPPERTPGAKR